MFVHCLRVRPCHLAAFFRTALAIFGALLAVVHLVLAALRAAGLADLGAYAANLVGELRAAAHEGRRAPACLGAVTVQADALGHFRHVLLVKTRAGTVFAFLGALHARFNTGMELVVSHINFLLASKGRDGVY